MSIDDWLGYATNKLNDAGIGTARLDTLVLTEDATGHDRAYLLAHPGETMQTTILRKLGKQVERRVSHEPLAYIRGFTEFYGRKFNIDQRVLEPRPESETMIDLVKKAVRGQTSHIVDVGTGSGALAITAKLELPSIEVLATDIDPVCLAVAKKNAKNLSVSIEFVQGDLLEPILNTKYFIPHTILANLPYIPEDFAINQAAMHEPRIAIYGGPDGLDIYRRLFKQIQSRNLAVSYIFTESMPPQHRKLEKVANTHGYKLSQTEDFIQLFVKN